jgi:hypothetical protein
MNPLFPLSPDFESASVAELREFIAASLQVAADIGADPSAYLTDERTIEQLTEEMTEGVAALEAARAALAALEAEPAEPETEPAVEPTEAPAEDRIAELAARAASTESEPEPDTEPDPEPDEPEAVIAAAPPDPAGEPGTPGPTGAPARLPRPPRPREGNGRPDETRLPVALTAAAENLGPGIGEQIDERELAEMMIRKHGQFGLIPEGTSGEKLTIARLRWDDSYPPERRLGQDRIENMALIASVIDQARIRHELQRRREGSLTASGGLCAPVTPYYNLQMLSVPTRPVRAALPSFNADRGGINYATPPALSSIDTGVGIKSAADDAAGGSDAVKTCQVIDCPGFQETDVNSVFHCLQFGNLGARTFPELVMQANSLTLAAHARLAESTLLTDIDGFSTAVDAAALGLGASATIPSQILTAANGMRSRNRMDEETVLRVLLPAWVLDLLVSDVYRGQFQRFEMTRERFVALLRAGNVEPSFYLDGAAGAGQVFGTQDPGALVEFPDEVRWYIFPEGSFLFLDGGTLELGLVRDSVLNATNDYQIFGETFEAVAFTGVESLAVTTPVCDSGTVSLPDNVTCPISYAGEET